MPTEIMGSVATTVTPPGPDSEHPAAWDRVIERTFHQRDRWGTDQEVPHFNALLEAMTARDKMGSEKYGRRLRPFNGQDPLAESLQEALDLCAYLANEEMERPSMAATQMVNKAIEFALAICKQYLATRSN